MKHKNKQINLNQTEFATDGELKAYLVALVLEYTTQMNEIETDISKKEEANKDFDFFPEFEKRYKPIFTRYTTEKRRVYGGQATAYGNPPQFDGIESAIEQDTILKTKNRAEIYFKTKNDEEAEYLFILLRQSALWRIDSAKNRFYGDKKWESMIL